MADPIHQFAITNLTPPLIKIGKSEIAFTNSALFMVIGVGLIILFFTMATRSRSLIPGRLQSMAELLYEFVAGTVRESAGHDGMKFFPLVFSLFSFVLLANLLGMLPGGFTVTSHIVVTGALAALVIGTVIVYGFIKNGIGFLKLFVPSNVPIWLLPLIVVIEFLSFLTRPISLSVRLFANMLGGHMALKLFAGFVATLLAAGAWAALSPLPLLIVIALTALEVLVAVLQAYVFAVLTVLYLNDALHPHH